MSLMISISGVRGIVGESLTPEVIVRFASAFAEYCKRHGHHKHVVLGRDGRTSGKVVGNLASSTILASGVDVLALGICTTPTIQLAVERTGAAGGISITASHNPIQWNGLKFLGPSGMFLDADENRELQAIAGKQDVHYATWDRTGKHTADDSWLGKHIDAILSARFVDPGITKKRGLKVVIDCVNGSGGLVVPQLLRKLGCEVHELHCDASGLFAHTPEPVPENLKDLCAAVPREKANLGIAVDPDGDRLVFITEEGVPFGEEYTVTAATKYVLSRGAENGIRHAKVVTNLSTTRAVDDVASLYTATVFRTPVGEINVARKMQETGAVIGGEGSGGVIYPAVHLGRDALAGIPLVLQLLVEHGGTMSELKESLPHYSIAKGKIELAGVDPERALNAVKKSLAPGARLNEEDGLRIDYPDHWVHLRKSNTEPIVRIIAEARTADEARSLVENYRRRLTG
jgi:phosphomannomutase